VGAVVEAVVFAAGVEAVACVEAVVGVGFVASLVAFFAVLNSFSEQWTLSVIE